MPASANTDETFAFSDEVQRRLGAIEFVLPKGIDQSSDPYVDGQIEEIPTGQAQAVPVPGTKVPGYSEIYRQPGYETGKAVTAFHPSVKTMYDAFKIALQRFPDAACLGERVFDDVNGVWANEYRYITYTDVAKRRTDFASGLVKLVADHDGGRTVSPTSRYIVTIYGPNCTNWAIADLACTTQSLTTATLYDTLGPETSEYILNLTKSPVLVVSVANTAKILKLKSSLPHLKVIICLESLTVNRQKEPVGSAKVDVLRAWASELGVALYTFNEVEQIGEKFPAPHQPPTAEDVYALNFTSGTTGNPKGAILSHSNIVGALAFTRGNLLREIDYSNVGTYFSFLPLAHIYERLNMCTFLSLGVPQAYPHGPLTEILDDIAVVKPAYTAMVPRVLNRIATVIKSLTVEKAGFGGALSRKVVESKLHRLHTTGSPNHPVWDFIWTRKIRKGLGFENLKFIATGSAPLSKENLEFLKIALGAEILQGYGLTESNSGISVSQRGEPQAGSCGKLAPTCELRLRDVPDYGYSSDDTPEPRGEIMLRGAQIFRGYYLSEDKTLEAFDKDGWFHTGDVGKIDATGRIFIIDRVKNFFKLAQGEYIGAEKIENAYISHCSQLSQLFIHGESTETYLVAIAGINPDTYAEWLAKTLKIKIAPTDFAALKKTFGDLKVRTAFLKTLNGAIPPGMLQGFERIKNIRLDIEPLNLENDTVTPTLKVKRNVAAKVFKDQITQMYKEGPLQESKPKL